MIVGHPGPHEREAVYPESSAASERDRVPWRKARAASRILSGRSDGAQRIEGASTMERRSRSVDHHRKQLILKESRLLPDRGTSNGRTGRASACRAGSYEIQRDSPTPGRGASRQTITAHARRRQVNAARERKSERETSGRDLQRQGPVAGRGYDRQQVYAECPTKPGRASAVVEREHPMSSIASPAATRPARAARAALGAARPQVSSRSRPDENRERRQSDRPVSAEVKNPTRRTSRSRTAGES